MTGDEAPLHAQADNTTFVCVMVLVACQARHARSAIQAGLTTQVDLAKQ
ncbi:hypothetical protein JWH04_07310 [Xanthomonas melonis]|nr:hypothetical protein [Xanthomonas melonis]MCD0278750.1 hypothetical protein [Xanthomonas melonis]